MRKNEDFEYFVEHNDEDIYIEDRGEGAYVVGRYAVSMNGSCVDDCLNKRRALSLANYLLKELENGGFE